MDKSIEDRLSKPTASRRYLSVPAPDQPPHLLDQMKTKIDSPEGRHIYARWLSLSKPGLCEHLRP